MTVTNNQTLFFIDSNINNYHTLISGIENADVVLLDSTQDGIEQITQTLSKYQHLDSIQILAHGDIATLQLGSIQLDSSNINTYNSQLNSWSNSLTESGDILLFGCNVGARTAGMNFINQLSQLTSADIAASDDLTGSSVLGGDWSLEITTGKIEAEIAVSNHARNSFDSVLMTYNGNQYQLTSSSLTWQEAQAEAVSLGGNLVTINDSAEQTWLESTFGTSTRLWTGFSDQNSEGNFTWVSGQNSSYSNWLPNKPDNRNDNEDYGVFSWNPNPGNQANLGKWNDWRGDRFLQGIIEIGGDNSVPTETFTFNGNEYRYTTVNASWQEAQAEAEALGGNLVTINNAAEQAWLESIFGTGERLWTGFNDQNSEGNFTWASGQNSSYSNWLPNKPDNRNGNENYGVFSWNPNPSNQANLGKWNDWRGDRSLQGIIEVENNEPSNPGVIGLETNNYQVNEADGTVTVNVARTQGSDGIITVDYRTFDASATDGEDYNAVSGTVTFADGQTNAAVTIPIINDNEAEGRENFSFTIDNVTGGATLLAPRTALVNIEDNDLLSGAVVNNGNQYLLTSGALTWTEAQAEAEALGGNLVTINDATEQAWLRNNFGIDEGFWIGINDLSNEGNFEWVSGQSVTYTNWANGEPNNAGGVQDFGWMNYQGDQWDDNFPTALLRGIIEIGGSNSSNNNNDSGNDTLNSETIVSGLNQPTAIEWTPNGDRFFIAEKGGTIKVSQNGQVLNAPFIDLTAQVNGTRDRGLLDIAVHPDFFNGSPYVYALYTYDPPEVFQNSGLAGEDGVGNRAARLTRITADPNTNFTTAIPGSEVVILGTNSTWDNFNGFVNSTNDFNEAPAGILADGTNLQDFLAADSESHTIGSVEFGIDGALYVSNGDGTSYNQVDPRTVRVQDIDNLSGKVLRIDPITGDGLTDNPFYNGNPNANRSKVYQLGLRNPFRMTVDPRNGDLYIGDVGWTQWEEINSAGAGANFGWPYYEGGSGNSLRTGRYQDLSEAQAFYNSGQSVESSILALNHGSTGINAIVLGDIYTGDAFPEEYQGDIFFSDLGRGIVYNASFDTEGNVTSFNTFTTGADIVVQIVEAPDGSLYYVDLDDGLVGRWYFD